MILKKNIGWYNLTFGFYKMLFLLSKKHIIR